MSKVYKKSAPGLAAAQKIRHVNYNLSLDLAEREAEKGNAFIIRPSIRPAVGRIEKNIDKLRDLYELGYTDAQICYDALMTFLES